MTDCQVVFKLNFALRHDEESDVHVGYCRTLDIYSQGRTEEEAEKAIISASALFIVSCYDKDILHNVLRQRGMAKASAVQLSKIVKSRNKDAEFIAVKTFDREFWHDVPISLVAQEATSECLQ